MLVEIRKLLPEGNHAITGGMVQVKINHYQTKEEFISLYIPARKGSEEELQRLVDSWNTTIHFDSGEDNPTLSVSLSNGKTMNMNKDGYGDDLTIFEPEGSRTLEFFSETFNAGLFLGECFFQLNKEITTGQSKSIN